MLNAVSGSDQAAFGAKTQAAQQTDGTDRFASAFQIGAIGAASFQSALWPLLSPLAAGHPADRTVPHSKTTFSRFGRLIRRPIRHRTMNGDRVREHLITLHGCRVVLRPMGESDWDVLSRWNNDAEVLWYSEGDDVTSRLLEDVKGIYREVSQTGFCFIIEVGGQPIGECWLQKMNLDRVLTRYPGKDCRRIDLTIGKKHMWGQGYGSDTISGLTRFGFEDEGVDLIFACGVADYNPRSRRAFEKIGYTVDQCIENQPGTKARYEYDLVLSIGDYLKQKNAERDQVAGEAGRAADGSR